MQSLMLILAVGTVVSVACAVLTRLAIRDDNWDRAIALITSLLILAGISFTILLPGSFTSDRDGPENGLLVLLAMLQTVGLWVVATITVLASFPFVSRRIR